jgi:hypothetical protein
MSARAYRLIQSAARWGQSWGQGGLTGHEFDGRATDVEEPAGEICSTHVWAT